MQIGELAKRANVPRSTLRYYEREGVLVPEARTSSGYRIYGERAVYQAKLIRHSQNLGLQLAEIREILAGDAPNGETLRRIAEHRYIELEKESARLAVQRHELRSILIDLERSGDKSPDQVLARLSSHVCHDENGRTHLGDGFRGLAARLNCALAKEEAAPFLDVLKQGHYHVWKYRVGYRILAVHPSVAASNALEALVRLESDCDAHPEPQLAPHREGTLLTVTGDASFLYATLFVHLDEVNELAPEPKRPTIEIVNYDCDS